MAGGWLGRFGGFCSAGDPSLVPSPGRGLGRAIWDPGRATNAMAARTFPRPNSRRVVLKGPSTCIIAQRRRRPSRAAITASAAPPIRPASPDESHTTKKRLRALVLNTRGLHVFLCHHIRDDGAVVAHVCASKYPKNHRHGIKEARRTFVKNRIPGDKPVTIIPLAHHWFGYHGEDLEEVVQRALYKEPDAEPSEEEDYSSDEVDPLID